MSRYYRKEASKPDLIAEHDTWISIDPVLGCPANCSYCYLASHGLIGVRPRIEMEPAEALERLSLYLGDRSDSTPICIGNYTDMLSGPATTSYLLKFMHLYSESNLSRPLCVVTKGVLTDAFVRELPEMDCTPLFFFSQSFARECSPRIELGKIASTSQTLENIARCAASMRATPIHFWRPFLSSLNTHDQIATRIYALKDAGVNSSVVIGLKGNHPTNFSGEQRVVGFVDNDVDEITVSHDEIFSNELWQYAKSIALKLELPLYRNTSCAIALSLKRAEALGTWREPIKQDKCLPANCPNDQRSKCELESHIKIKNDDVFAIIETHFGTELSRSFFFDSGNILCSKEPIDEFVLNQIHHLVGVAPLNGGVIRRKAWLGSFSGRNGNEE